MKKSDFAGFSRLQLSVRDGSDGKRQPSSHRTPPRRSTSHYISCAPLILNSHAPRKTLESESGSHEGALFFSRKKRNEFNLEREDAISALPLCCFLLCIFSGEKKKRDRALATATFVPSVSEKRSCCVLIYYLVKTLADPCLLCQYYLARRLSVFVFSRLLFIAVEKAESAHTQRKRRRKRKNKSIKATVSVGRTRDLFTCYYIASVLLSWTAP